MGVSAGLEVAIEVVKAKRDPNNPDTDGDGLWDGDEYFGDKEGLYQLALQNGVWVWTSSGGELYQVHLSFCEMERDLTGE